MAIGRMITHVETLSTTNFDIYCLKKRGILFCSVLWGCLAAVVSTIMPAVAAIVSTIMPAVMSSVVSAVMPVAAVMSSMVVSVC